MKNEFPDSDTRPLHHSAPTFYPNCVRFPARHSRTGRGRRIACSGSHQTTHHGEVSKRFGSLNGLSVTQKQNTVPKEPRIVFSAIKLPEPSGCYHRPVLALPRYHWPADREDTEA